MELEDDGGNQDLMHVDDMRLNLTPEELAMEIDKELTTNNPQAAHNIMQYSFKDRKFIKADVTDHVVNHYSCEGDKLLVHMPMTEKEAKANANPTETAEYAEQEE